MNRKALHELYFGRTRAAIRFQSVWLVFDLVLIAFFMVAPFIERGPLFLVVDYCIAAVLALDLAARAWAYGNFRRWFVRPIAIVDIIVLLSLLVPLASNFGFLRVLRAYSLVNGSAFWRVIGRRSWLESGVAETIKAVTNLGIFIFMMAALVHTAFATRVPALTSFMDSLYFTITALSTTGFGDIVLPGFWGRAVSIVIMIGGVTLFFRLVQVMMRSHKVRHPCPTCGQLRHEADSVHCKACGTLLNIRHDNE
jgi:voltage-gated potassium channel